MFVGFLIGLLEFARIAGIVALGAVGGLAVGVRVVLFGDNLLVGTYFVNWFIVGICGVVGVGLVFLRRFGIVRFSPRLKSSVLWI